MKTSPTAGKWLNAAVLRLLECAAGEKTRPEAALEAQVLLARAFDRPRSWLLAHPEAPLTPGLLALLEAQLDLLAGGTPLPYLTGQQEFYGMDFEVSPDVLIPRPETELLVDTALAWLANHPSARLAADIGTGSGCIAAVLARHAPNLRLVASDLSFAALQIARRNLARHGLLGRVSLLQSDLLSALSGPLSDSGPLDLICANLPYIPTETLSGLSVTRHEPRLALDGGPDGLHLVARLLAEAPCLLAPTSLALLEIESRQRDSATNLARAVFPNATVDVRCDLAGLPRLLQIELRK